jgi:hypothetical protein
MATRKKGKMRPRMDDDPGPHVKRPKKKKKKAKKAK